ncbi:MAG: hypothetical protein KQH57_01895 [Actinomycetales bacterium]|nr:hypothetical protein [Actinomycetales bacterium]
MEPRTSRAIRAALVGAALLVLLAACAASGNDFTGTAGATRGPVGFWWGLWQGFIAPFAFIVSLFNSDVGIYEVHNNGGWYDLGFLFGLSIIFGGGPAGSSARKRRRR